MNAQTAKDYLPLVQALAEGKTIQESSEQQHYWSDSEEVIFSLPASRYRIKREPRRYWILESDDGQRVTGRATKPQITECFIEVVEVIK